MQDAQRPLVRKAIDVNLANLALGHDIFVADGATFVRNTEFPMVYDANYVSYVTASSPDEIDTLLARVEREYVDTRHYSIRTEVATPPEFEARLVLEGYATHDALIMLLEGDLIATPKPFDIRPIVDDAGWAAFHALNVHDWAEHSERLSIPDADKVGVSLARSQQLKSPPVRYWLAYDDGEPRGYFSSWEGREGVGQVENLFVRKDYRHRGIATALIAHCVADARAHGAGPITIVCDPTDTPKRMYAALGFRPIALQRSWLKKLDA